MGIQIQLLGAQRQSDNNLILYVAIYVSIYDGLLYLKVITSELGKELILLNNFNF